MAQNIPPTHKALLLTSTSKPPTIQTLPTPTAIPGSALIRIHAVNLISYMPAIYSGRRPYPLSLPLIIGTSAIGRIAALGADSTFLQPGQLVFIDSFIHSRDNPEDAMLLGISSGFDDRARKLMDGEWRDATFAEYAKVPLENVHVLDEGRLLGSKEEGGLGYRVEELSDISRLAVGYGGLNSIDVKAGETVIVAPATGPFGSAVVKVAHALGARVLAMGRNMSVLEKLKEEHERVEIVPLTNDLEVDLAALQKFGKIDAYFDISPPEAAESTHYRSCILALRRGGRVSLMGGIGAEVPIPMGFIVRKDIRLVGKWMYDREDIAQLIGMIEMGLLGLQGDVKTFKLEDWEEAFETAEREGASGRSVIVP
ncbi:hypothetical protein HYFRA_00008908 [Hymenoscyphus fraxineus]|uniref:Alcohol dehydrogenase n=1 Tax=Hymenoscyphus fraxineus TaxID=746836 RepID=A0A9N9KT68_9HELO|nr:hypothetical protein HYFRA_00008908 [Hymenoscyphus fraxineus]